MTDFCKQLFRKSIRELTIEDLKHYFSEAKEETEILEFKSGKGDFEGVFNKNILRAVAAFLNSSGGILIWGAPENKIQENGKAKVCVGELVPVNERREKDQLINRIASSISYMPTGIKIERLDLNDGYIYIIEVQESQSKPHQLNGQYLIRLDGQSKPAPHYIVDSMFKQEKFAQVECWLKIVKVHHTMKDEYFKITFEIKTLNKSPFLPARDLFVQILTSEGVFEVSNEQSIEIFKTDLLYYGIYPNKRAVLILKKSKLRDGTFGIQTVLGGSNVPTNVSEYKINARDFIHSGSFIDNFNDTIKVQYFNKDLHTLTNVLVNNKEKLKQRFFDQ